jgi:RNA polymerase sigma factor (sigma-70 family)
MPAMEASAVPRAAPAGVSVVFQSPNLLRLASDARLVTLVRERNAGAFETVYNRHHRAILSFCRHMLGDAQEAEDAVQHTFLAAYSDLISSTKQIHLRAWLFTIARNRCYSVLRGRREQPSSDLDEPVTEGLAAQVQRRQDLRDLVVDMQRLPEEQRAALVLAELDALSHEEIADTLGVAPKKVKALVFQARESLLASRVARETDCSEIREQLATQRGGALRRGNLRRHLRECAGCRDFRREIERQRRRLAVLLPVVPTLALREAVLGAGAGGGAAAGLGGAGGAVFSTALKSGLVRVSIGALAAGGGTAGTLVATHDLVLPSISSYHGHRHASAAARNAFGGSAAVAKSSSASPVSDAASLPEPARALKRSPLSPLVSTAAPVRSASGSLWIRDVSALGPRSSSRRSSLSVLVGPALPQRPAATPAPAAPPVALATAPITAAPATPAPPAPVVSTPPTNSSAPTGPGKGAGQHDGAGGSGRGSSGASNSSAGVNGNGSSGGGSGASRHTGTDGGGGSTSTSRTGTTSGTPTGTTRGSGPGNGPTPAGTTGSTGTSSSTGTTTPTKTGTSGTSSSGTGAGTSGSTTSGGTTSTSPSTSGTSGSAGGSTTSGTSSGTSSGTGVSSGVTVTAPHQTTVTYSGTPR